MNFRCFYFNFIYNIDILLLFPIPMSFPTALMFNYLVSELSELNLNT